MSLFPVTRELNEYELRECDSQPPSGDDDAELIDGYLWLELQALQRNLLERHPGLILSLSIHGLKYDTYQELSGLEITRGFTRTKRLQTNRATLYCFPDS